MNNEELNRKMEFIVEQQARFATDIQVMREIHEADTKLLKQETKLLKEGMELLKEQVFNLSGAVTTVVGMIGNIAQVQQTTVTQIGELALSQLRTDERLNVIIDVIERYFGGNGTRPAQGPA